MFANKTLFIETDSKLDEVHRLVILELQYMVAILFFMNPCFSIILVMYVNV